MAGEDSHTINFAKLAAEAIREELHGDLKARLDAQGKEAFFWPPTPSRPTAVPARGQLQPAAADAGEAAGAAPPRARSRSVMDGLNWILDALQKPPLPEAIAAVIGVIVGWLLTRADARRLKPKERLLLGSAYLEALATGLLDMADAFQKSTVPHEAGNRVLGLMAQFEQRVGKHVDKSIAAAVSELLDRAKQLDSELLSMLVQISNGPERDAMIADLQRRAAILRVEAEKLRGQAVEAA